MDETKIFPELHTAAQAEPKVWTEDCLEPDDLIRLSETGASSPADLRQMAHVALCSYCADAFDAMEQTLQMASAARDLQQLPTPLLWTKRPPSVWEQMLAYLRLPALAGAAGALLVLVPVGFGLAYKQHDMAAKEQSLLQAQERQDEVWNGYRRRIGELEAEVSDLKGQLQTAKRKLQTGNREQGTGNRIRLDSSPR